jgi:hypothetical protein
MGIARKTAILRRNAADPKGTAGPSLCRAVPSTAQPDARRIAARWDTLALVRGKIRPVSGSGRDWDLAVPATAGQLNPGLVFATHLRKKNTFGTVRVLLLNQ